MQRTLSGGFLLRSSAYQVITGEYFAHQDHSNLEESEDDDESSLSESESEWGCDAVVLPIHAATPCRPTQAKLGVRTSICADTADRV
jgi:hypothetical protein